MASPQTVTVPYFIGTTVPSPKVGALIACSGFDAAQFGNSALSPATIGGGERSVFGTAQVGTKNPALVVNDDRLPEYLSLTYVFNPGYKLYAFGFSKNPPAPRVTGVTFADPVANGGFGTSMVGPSTNSLVISSTDLPSNYTTLKFPFGVSLSLLANPFVTEAFGVPTMTSVVSGDSPIDASAFGTTMVGEAAKPLRLRDSKSAAPKYGAVPFQWGGPKYQIFTMGVTSAGVSSPTLPLKVYPPGVTTQAMSNNWWPWPLVLQGSQTITFQWIRWAQRIRVGSPSVSNTNRDAILPKGFVDTVISGASVYNTRRSIHAGGDDYSLFGTGAVSCSQQVIKAFGWQPYLESFARVWHAGPQVVGIVPSITPAALTAVQCVLNNPVRYYMEGFKDTYIPRPHVTRRVAIYPTGVTTIFGVIKVGHYTRYLDHWNPFKNTIVPEPWRVINKNYVTPASISRPTLFGDVHRVEENLIRLRPWEAGVIPSPSTQMFVQPEGVVGSGEITVRIAQPIRVPGLHLAFNDPQAVASSGGFSCGSLPRSVAPNNFVNNSFGDFDVLV